MFVARSTPPTFRIPGWIMSWLRVRKGCLPTGSLKLMQHARRRDTILLNPDEMRLIHSWSSSGAFDGFAILDSSRHTPLWWHVAHTHTPTCGGFAGTYLVRIDMARTLVHKHHLPGARSHKPKLGAAPWGPTGSRPARRVFFRYLFFFSPLFKPSYFSQLAALSKTPRAVS